MLKNQGGVMFFSPQEVKLLIAAGSQVQKQHDFQGTI